MQSEAGPHAQRKPVITCKHMQAQLKAAISPPAHLLQCRVIPKDTASPAHPCRLSLLARLALLHHLCAQPLQPPLAALSLDGGGHLQDCCGKRAMSFDHDANQRSPPAAAAPPPAMPAQVEEGSGGPSLGASDSPAPCVATCRCCVCNRTPAGTLGSKQHPRSRPPACNPTLSFWAASSAAWRSAAWASSRCSSASWRDAAACARRKQGRQMGVGPASSSMQFDAPCHAVSPA